MNSEKILPHEKPAGMFRTKLSVRSVLIGCVVFIISAQLTCSQKDVFSNNDISAQQSKIVYYASGTNGSLYRINDLASGVWTDISPGGTLPFYDALFIGPRLFVMGGAFPPGSSGFVQSSSDMTAWTSHLTGARVVRGIVFNGMTYCIYGDDGGNKQIWYSSDGLTWTVSATIPNGTYNNSFNLLSGAYGSGYFLVAGGYSSNGEVIRSADGITWTVVSPNCNYLNGIAFHAGRFVAVGRAGTVLYSDDAGTSWTSAGSVGSLDHTSIVYGNGIYIAVGNSGQIYRSADGVTWVNVTSGISENLTKVVYLNNRFIAVGNNGTVLWSTDGAVWNNVSIGSTYTLYSIASITQD
jgi:hypothetical protein